MPSTNPRLFDNAAAKPSHAETEFRAALDSRAPPGFDEISIARRFVNFTAHAGSPTIASLPEQGGRWLLFDPIHGWKRDTRLAYRELIAQYLEREVDEYALPKEVAKKIASDRTIMAVSRIVQADGSVATTTSDWDQDPELIGTPAGIVNLRDGSISPRPPKIRISLSTGCAPAHEDGRVASDFERGCPTWLAVLDRWCSGNAPLVGYLRRLFGYALTGYTREQMFAFIFGTGANGKSTLLNTLLKLTGDYGGVVPSDLFLETSGDRHPTELAILLGRRVVVAAETPVDRKFNAMRLKSLTGGEPIAARYMRGDFFEFVPTCKVLMAGNHRPGLRVVDEAMRRRLHLIEFSAAIPAAERDPRLEDKLDHELSWILAWAISGAREYLSCRLAPPVAVLDATADFFEGEDELAQWVDECCERRGWASPKELYKSWAAWAHAAGLSPGNQKQFGDRLISAGFRRNRTGLKGRHFDGITLRDLNLPGGDGW